MENLFFSIICDRLRVEIFIAEQTSLTECSKLNSKVIKFTSDKEEGKTVKRLKVTPKSSRLD